MNEIVFQVKRAHRASVKACSWMIRVVKDMTPARFDIMFVLRHAALSRGRTDLGGCSLDQRRLVRDLGLHKSTVSEALARLEELGWVSRTRDYADGRLQVVAMTALGLRRTFEACKILFHAKVLKRSVDRLVRLLEPLRPFNEAFDRVWENINGIARYFGDTSTFEYYDRQVAYAVPRFSATEIRHGRCYGTDSGSRLPDFVIEFLERRERQRETQRRAQWERAWDREWNSPLV